MSRQFISGLCACEVLPGISFTIIFVINHHRRQSIYCAVCNSLLQRFTVTRVTHHFYLRVSSQRIYDNESGRFNSREQNNSRSFLFNDYCKTFCHRIERNPIWRSRESSTLFAKLDDEGSSAASLYRVANRSETTILPVIQECTCVARR